MSIVSLASTFFRFCGEKKMSTPKVASLEFFEPDVLEFFVGPGPSLSQLEWWAPQWLRYLLTCMWLGCVHRQVILITVHTVAFQQLLLPYSLQTHQITFSICSKSEVATFWKHAGNTECACTLCFSTRGSNLANWLCHQLDRTSDVSDPTSPECNFASICLK